MAYEVPALPYAYDALEPHIDAQTMTIHHDKHHQAYVDKTNAALEGTEWADKPIDEVVANLVVAPGRQAGPPSATTAAATTTTPSSGRSSAPDGGEPTGELADAIDAKFGSLDAFKEKFEAAGVGQFGSGWAWLVARRRRARHHLDRQPGLPADRRQDPAARQRRLGARLLPQVPERAPGLPQGVLERRQLGQGRRAFRSREVA